ncbi:hypothetical protein Gpo141_00000159 [Globisporangium polare]
MVSTSNSLFTTLVVASAAASVSAVAELGSTSGSGSNAIPLCDQKQLVELGTILKSNARKLQCQSVLNITEMLKPPNNNYKMLCDEVPCTVALTSLYNTLPQCRYQDWSPQSDSGKILRYCGIVPENTTDPGSGSFSGTTTTTVSPTPVATWSSSSSSGTTSFAPVGAATTAPVAATPSPTPTKSMAVATPLASALVLATSLLAAVAFA